MFYRIHLPQGPKKIWCNINVASNDYKDVIKMLQRCYKDVTKMLQRCYKDVIKMLQKCYKDVALIDYKE